MRQKINVFPKILMALLAVFISIGLCVTFDQKTEVYGAVSTESFSGGAGTATNPYQISTAGDLAIMAQLINGTSASTSGDAGLNYNKYGKAYYVLTANIDLSGRIWTPIGAYSAKPFAGYFGGNGYTISNMTIDETITTSALGLFGYVNKYNSTNNETVVIENLQLKNVSIEAYYSTTSSYASSVGALAGNVSNIISATQGYTKIQNINVDGVTIVNNYSSTYAGGLIGLLSTDMNLTGLTTEVNDQYALENIAVQNLSITGGSRGGVVGRLENERTGETTSEASYKQNNFRNCIFFSTDITGFYGTLSGTSGRGNFVDCYRRTSTTYYKFAASGASSSSGSPSSSSAFAFSYNAETGSSIYLPRGVGNVAFSFANIGNVDKSSSTSQPSVFYGQTQVKAGVSSSARVVDAYSTAANIPNLHRVVATAYMTLYPYEIAIARTSAQTYGNDTFTAQSLTSSGVNTRTRTDRGAITYSRSINEYLGNTTANRVYMTGGRQGSFEFTTTFYESIISDGPEIRLLDISAERVVSGISVSLEYELHTYQNNKGKHYAQSASLAMVSTGDTTSYEAEGKLSRYSIINVSSSTLPAGYRILGLFEGTGAGSFTLDELSPTSDYVYMASGDYICIVVSRNYDVQFVKDQEVLQSGVMCYGGTTLYEKPSTYSTSDTTSYDDNISVPNLKEDYSEPGFTALGWSSFSSFNWSEDYKDEPIFVSDGSYHKTRPDYSLFPNYDLDKTGTMYFTATGTNYKALDLYTTFYAVYGSNMNYVNTAVFDDSGDSLVDTNGVFTVTNGDFVSGSGFEVNTHESTSFSLNINGARIDGGQIVIDNLATKYETRVEWELYEYSGTPSSYGDLSGANMASSGEITFDGDSVVLDQNKLMETIDFETHSFKNGNYVLVFVVKRSLMNATLNIAKGDYLSDAEFEALKSGGTDAITFSYTLDGQALTGLTFDSNGSYALEYAPGSIVISNFSIPLDYEIKSITHTAPETGSSSVQGGSFSYNSSRNFSTGAYTLTLNNVVAGGEITITIGKMTTGLTVTNQVYYDSSIIGQTVGSSGNIASTEGGSVDFSGTSGLIVSGQEYTVYVSVNEGYEIKNLLISYYSNGISQNVDMSSSLTYDSSNNRYYFTFTHEIDATTLSSWTQRVSITATFEREKYELTKEVEIGYLSANVFVPFDASRASAFASAYTNHYSTSITMNGTVVTNINNNGTVYYGMTIIPSAGITNALALESYRISTTGSYNNALTSNSFTMTGNVTLTTFLVARDYDVVFMSGGVQQGETKELYYGDSVGAVPDVSTVGYDVTGWSCGSLTYEESQIPTLTINDTLAGQASRDVITFTAQLSAIEYDLNFEWPNGYYMYDSVSYGERYTFYRPTKVNATFLGWSYATASGVEKFIPTEDDIYFNGSYSWDIADAGREITFRSVFDEKEFTITFENVAYSLDSSRALDYVYTGVTTSAVREAGTYTLSSLYSGSMGDSYIFVGFYIGEISGSPVSSITLNDTNYPSQEVKVYAVYSNYVELTFTKTGNTDKASVTIEDSLGNTVAELTSSQTSTSALATVGEALTFSVNCDPGYEFSATYSASVTSGFVVNRNTLALTINITGIVYTGLLDANGGNFEDISSTALSGVYGQFRVQFDTSAYEYMTAQNTYASGFPTPSRAGYTFVGWKLGDDFVYEVGGSYQTWTTALEGQTLVAEWALSEDLSITETTSPVTYNGQSQAVMTASVNNPVASLTYTIYWYSGENLVQTTSGSSSALMLTNVWQSGTYRYEVVVSNGASSVTYMGSSLQATISARTLTIDVGTKTYSTGVNNELAVSNSMASNLVSGHTLSGSINLRYNEASRTFTDADISNVADASNLAVLVGGSADDGQEHRYISNYSITYEGTVSFIASTDLAQVSITSGTAVANNQTYIFDLTSTLQGTLSELNGADTEVIGDQNSLSFGLYRYSEFSVRVVPTSGYSLYKVMNDGEEFTNYTYRDYVFSVSTGVISGDLNLVLYFTNQAIVTFDQNLDSSETPDSNVPEKAVYTRSSQANLPAPARLSFEFNNWAYAGGSMNSGAQTWSFTGEITLTAQWSISTPLVSDNSLDIYYGQTLLGNNVTQYTYDGTTFRAAGSTKAENINSVLSVSYILNVMNYPVGGSPQDDASGGKLFSHKGEYSFILLVTYRYTSNGQTMSSNQLTISRSFTILAPDVTGIDSTIQSMFGAADFSYTYDGTNHSSEIEADVLAIISDINAQYTSIQMELSSLTLTSGAINAGSFAATASFTYNSNYDNALSSIEISYDIERASLTISSVDGITKVYDANTSFLGSVEFATGVNSETLTMTSATYASANVGSGIALSNISVADGIGLVSNYNVTFSGVTGDITAKDVTIDVGTTLRYSTNVSYTYDVASASVSGLLSDHTLSGNIVFSSMTGGVFVGEEIKGVADESGLRINGGAIALSNYNLTYVGSITFIDESGLAKITFTTAEATANISSLDALKFDFNSLAFATIDSVTGSATEVTGGGDNREFAVSSGNSFSVVLFGVPENYELYIVKVGKSILSNDSYTYSNGTFTMTMTSSGEYDIVLYFTNESIVAYDVDKYNNETVTGISNAQYAVVVTNGVETTLPSPQIDDLTFLHWEDESGVDYQAGNHAFGAGEIVRLIARWEIADISLSNIQIFDNLGAEITQNSVAYDISKSYDVRVNLVTFDNTNLKVSQSVTGVEAMTGTPATDGNYITYSSFSSQGSYTFALSYTLKYTTASDEVLEPKEFSISRSFQITEAGTSEISNALQALFDSNAYDGGEYDGQSRQAAIVAHINALISGSAYNNLGLTVTAQSQNNFDIVDAKVYTLSFEFEDVEGYNSFGSFSIEASISPREITITSISGITKVYDASSSYSGSVTFETGVNGENLIVTSATFTNVNVGTRALADDSFIVNDGTGKASNYNVTFSGVTGSITARELTLDVGTSLKYATDIDNRYEVSSAIVSGLLNGQTLSGYLIYSSSASGTFADAQILSVATQHLAITIGGSTGEGDFEYIENYSLAFVGSIEFLSYGNLANITLKVGSASVNSALTDFEYTDSSSAVTLTGVTNAVTTPIWNGAELTFAVCNGLYSGEGSKAFGISFSISSGYSLYSVKIQNQYGTQYLTNYSLTNGTLTITATDSVLSTYGEYEIVVYFTNEALVTYDLNLETGETPESAFSNEALTYGETKTFTAPTRNSFSFGGWRYEETSFRAGQSYTWSLTGKVELVAQWTLNAPSEAGNQIVVYRGRYPDSTTLEAQNSVTFDGSTYWSTVSLDSSVNSVVTKSFTLTCTNATAQNGVVTGISNVGTYVLTASITYSYGGQTTSLNITREFVINSPNTSEINSAILEAFNDGDFVFTYDATDWIDEVLGEVDVIIASLNVAHSGLDLALSSRNIGSFINANTYTVSLSFDHNTNVSINENLDITVVVNARNITINALNEAVTKTYDRTTAVTGSYTFTTDLGEILSVVVSGANYSDYNSGTAKAITGLRAGDLGTALASNYSVTFENITGDITAKEVTINLFEGGANITRNYSGSVVSLNAVGYMSDTAILAGDNVSVVVTTNSAEVGIYDSLDTSRDKYIILNVTNNENSNYTFTISGGIEIVSARATFEIDYFSDELSKVYDATQHDITFTIMFDGGESRYILREDGVYTYDGGTLGTLVSEISLSASLTSNVGTNANVFVIRDAGTYTFSLTTDRFNFANTTVQATISRYNLSYTDSDQKVYDRQGYQKSLTVSGLGGETVSYTVSEPNFINVGNYGVNHEFTNNNYSLTVDYELSITPLNIAISVPSSLTQVYDGTTAVSSQNLSSLSITGLLSGDENYVTISSASFNEKNVGTQGLNSVVLGGTLAGNYNVVLDGSEVIEITQRPISVIGDAGAFDKVYDGTIAVDTSRLSLNGLVAGDDVSFSGTYADKNVGSKSISFSMSGDDSPNYSFSQAVYTGNISQRTLELEYLIGGNLVYDSSNPNLDLRSNPYISKPYDGTTAILGSSASSGSSSYTGLRIKSGTLCGSDIVYIEFENSYYSGSAIGVYEGSNLVITIGGQDSANYVLSEGLRGEITSFNRTITINIPRDAENSNYQAFEVTYYGANGPVSSNTYTGPINAGIEWTITPNEGVEFESGDITALVTDQNGSAFVVQGRVNADGVMQFVISNFTQDLTLNISWRYKSYNFSANFYELDSNGQYIPNINVAMWTNSLLDSYSYFDRVDLSATPNTGYEFVSYIRITGYNTDGSVSSFEVINSPLIIQRDEDIGAVFRLTSHGLEIIAGEGGSVLVSVDGEESSVTASQSFTVTYGQSVSLTAVASSGYRFSSWTGSQDTSGSLSFTVTGNASFTANFELKDYNVVFEYYLDGASTGTYFNGANSYISSISLAGSNVDTNGVHVFGIKARTDYVLSIDVEPNFELDYARIDNVSSGTTYFNSLDSVVTLNFVSLIDESEQSVGGKFVESLITIRVYLVTKIVNVNANVILVDENGERIEDTSTLASIKYQNASGQWLTSGSSYSGSIDAGARLQLLVCVINGYRLDVTAVNTNPNYSFTTRDYSASYTGDDKGFYNDIQLYTFDPFTQNVTVTFTMNRTYTDVTLQVAPSGGSVADYGENMYARFYFGSDQIYLRNTSGTYEHVNALPMPTHIRQYCYGFTSDLSIGNTIINEAGQLNYIWNNAVDEITLYAIWGFKKVRVEINTNVGDSTPSALDKTYDELCDELLSNAYVGIYDEGETNYIYLGSIFSLTVPNLSDDFRFVEFRIFSTELNEYISIPNNGTNSTIFNLRVDSFEDGNEAGLESGIYISTSNGYIKIDDINPYIRIQVVCSVRVTVNATNFYRSNRVNEYGGVVSVNGLDSTYVTPGEEGVATLVATPAEGYDFVYFRWNDKNGLEYEITQNNHILTITEPTTIYAYFKGKPIKVTTAALDGGSAPTFSGGNPEEINGEIYYHIGDVLRFSYTPREGYFHSGYETFYGGTVLETFGTNGSYSLKLISNTLYSELTIRPTETEKVVNVTFILVDSNGQIATMDSNWNIEITTTTQGNDIYSSFRMSYHTDLDFITISPNIRYDISNYSYSYNGLDFISNTDVVYINEDNVLIWRSQDYGNNSNIFIRVEFERVYWYDFVEELLDEPVAEGASLTLRQQIEAGLYSFGGGAGTEERPYQLNAVRDLAILAYMINNDLSGVDDNYNNILVWYDYNFTLDYSERFWTPIGTLQNPFNATFKLDGGRVGIYVDEQDENYIARDVFDYDNVYRVYGGLFGALGPDANIIQENNAWIIWLVLGLTTAGIILAIVLAKVISTKRKRAILEHNNKIKS